MKKLLLLLLCPALALADNSSLSGPKVTIDATDTVSICAANTVRIATNCDGNARVLLINDEGGITLPGEIIGDLFVTDDAEVSEDLDVGDDLTVTGDTGLADVGISGLLSVEGTFSREGVVKFVPGILGRAGATAGFAGPSAHSGLTDSAVVGVPENTTAATYVLPLPGLKVGDTVTAFSVHGQIESAGGTVTVDATLRKVTFAAANPTDASLGGITQVSAVADTLVAASKTIDTPEVLAATELLYVLITVTTGATTDFQLNGITFTVNES